MSGNINARDWYDYLMILIQIGIAVGTIWAAWAATTHQRNMGKLKLYEPRIWLALWLSKKSGILKNATKKKLKNL